MPLLLYKRKCHPAYAQVKSFPEAKEIYIYDLLGKQVVVQKENLVRGYNEVVLYKQALPSEYYQVLIEDISMRLIPTRFIIDRL